MIKTKQKNINFYHVQKGKKDDFSFKEELDDIYNKFRSKRYTEIEELELDSVHFYISAIQKIEQDTYLDWEDDSIKHYYYLINIARVDADQEVKYGDLSKLVNEREEVVDLSDEDVDMSKIGPLVDTQFVIDPFFAVVGMGRTVGGANAWALKQFLQTLFDVRGLKFEIILDEKSQNEINKMSLVQAISFNVASTTDPADFHDSSRDEMGDVKLAKQLKATEYEIKLSATNLDKDGVIEKVKNLFINKDYDHIKSIRVEGLEDGVEVFFDLIRNKLQYRGNMKFDDAVGVTTRNNFDYLSMAYDSKIEFVSSKIAKETN
ncbi:hypothetical protein C6P08_09160 [Weissella confusa]|uniref:hypothetical protein n=1 Tax=Weissella confusa TaxID=1583 RepID=UPI001091D04A|nr:hypothetical protein [Weissella confusa]MBJ7695315.1 hypothetical protein [Weissella confusa]QBZ05348.1 hypothetical protein C6P08_09160 [Weissella confusa]